MQQDWIEWRGGKCPVSGDTLVLVKLSAREKAERAPLRIRADFLNWHFNDDGGDIIAYRVVSA